MHLTRTHHRRALLVDDDIHVRRALRRYLRRRGWEVYDAANGGAALALFTRHAFQLVLSDWDMPGVDGLALLERIADAGVPSCRLVMMTANDTASALLDSLRDRGITILRKPLDPTGLDVIVPRTTG